MDKNNKINEDDIKCPNCGETENFHFNHDYSKKDLPVINILCNECGSIFTDFIKE